MEVKAKIKRHIEKLNDLLKEKDPDKVSSSWIYRNLPSTYMYIWKHVRTETGSIDWDLITSGLNKEFAKKWVRYRYKNPALYEDRNEVDKVLLKYKEKLYTLISQENDSDRLMQDKIIIYLVRLGQKGNVCAQDELVKWIIYTTDDWINKYQQLYKWQGYPDEVETRIKGCIRCYRYTGSFLGYLFKTLEYSARGKPPIVSLNDRFCDGEKERIDYVVLEE